MPDPYPSLTYTSDFKIKKQILVCSNKLKIFCDLTTILNSNVYQLIQAKSSIDVLKIIPQNQVSIIILDLDFLGLDGILTAKVIKSRAPTKHIPLIILHNHQVSSKLLIDGCQGCIDYLSKPYTLATLRTKICNFIQIHNYLEQIKHKPHQLSEFSPTQPIHIVNEMLNCTKDIYLKVDLKYHIVYLNKSAVNILPKLLQKQNVLIGENFYQDLQNSGYKSLLSCLHQTMEGKTNLDSEAQFNDIFYKVHFFRVENGVAIHIHELSTNNLFEGQIISFNESLLTSEMAAKIAHEIKNPITTIRALLELSKLAQKPIPQDKIKVIIQEIDRINAIITDFLSLGKNKKSTYETHNIETIISEMRDLLDAKATQMHKHIIYELKPTGKVMIDIREISQLILNIVLNGLEAMESQGSNLTIKTDNSNRHVYLHISDQGPGIEPLDLKNIWKPFYTTKANGTGLGLAICRKLAAKNDAEILIRSGKNGTTFSIKFDRMINTEQ